MAVDPKRVEATRLGSYEILRRIARGGMAEIYLARTKGPEGFEKVVVLKKILATHAENPKFVRLFLDEAKLAATLDHPHIAHVYDMGMVDGAYFFTMEFVHGQDVRTTLRRTARLAQLFPIDHAVQIARNIAAALHYAHERRRADGALLEIVHRDVSPSNIIISYDGATKLVDFGVAKAATSTEKTRTGTLKGKISYMSPEQAKGAPIDRRSDIFSLGIVLWEMVTTNRLFKAENDLATIQMIINSKAQPPTQQRPDCPPELERIILKALSPDLATRYQTAEEMQLDLEELAREHRLKQSNVALRAHMHVLFDAEIQAWKDAQASGITLTDHVIGATTSDMTTPVSESEVEYLGAEPEEEEDDEDEDAATYDPPTLQNPSLSPSAGATTTPGPPPVIEPPTAPVPRLDATPASVVQQQSGPVAAPFPIAPKEWMPAPPTLLEPDAVRLQRRKKQIAIGGAIGFGLLVIAALAFGGGGDNAEDPPVPVHKKMTVTQPPPDPAPAPPPPAPQETAPAPAPESCDALEEKGRQNEAIGQHAAALANIEDALKCQPTERRYQLAFMSACNAGDAAKAKLYYGKAGPMRSSLKQMCVRNGINVDAAPK